MKYTLLAAALLLSIPAAHAADQADGHSRFVANVGYASLNQKGDTVVPVQLGNGWPRGTEVENSDDGGAATLGLSWYVTRNIALELWGATRADSDVEIDVENAPDVHVARYSTRPLALSVQYHFNDAFSVAGKPVVPFVGLGYHRTEVSGVSGTVAVPGFAGLEIDDGSGLAATAGVDVNLGNHWFVRGDVRYLQWDTESTVGGRRLATADMDTLTYGASIGVRF